MGVEERKTKSRGGLVPRPGSLGSEEGRLSAKEVMLLNCGVGEES